MRLLSNTQICRRLGDGRAEAGGGGAQPSAVRRRGRSQGPESRAFPPMTTGAWLLLPRAQAEPARDGTTGRDPCGGGLPGCSPGRLGGSVCGGWATAGGKGLECKPRLRTCSDQLAPGDAEHRPALPGSQGGSAKGRSPLRSRKRVTGARRRRRPPPHSLVGESDKLGISASMWDSERGRHLLSITGM